MKQELLSSIYRTAFVATATALTIPASVALWNYLDAAAAKETSIMMKNKAAYEAMTPAQQDDVWRQACEHNYKMYQGYVPESARSWQQRCSVLKSLGFM